MVKYGPLKILDRAEDIVSDKYMNLNDFINWADLAWIPVALLVEHRGKKIFSALFAAACSLLLRLQVDMLVGIGFPEGVFGLMDMPELMRGQITYSIFILFFFVISYYSKGANNHIHIAASITILIAAFCVSTLVMVL